MTVFICPKTNRPCELTGCFEGSLCYPLGGGTALPEKEIPIEILEFVIKKSGEKPVGEKYSYIEVCQLIKDFVTSDSATIDSGCDAVRSSFGNTDEQRNGLVVWNGIDGEFWEVDSLDHALKEIKENFSDSEEGIHPDIESVIIYQQVASVAVRPIPGKETYKIVLEPYQSPLSSEGEDGK